MFKLPWYVQSSKTYIASLPENSRILLAPPPSPISGESDVYNFGYFSRTPLPFQIPQKSLVTNVEVNSFSAVINLFPNPATNEIKIEKRDLQIELVEIYNVLGEKVLAVCCGPACPAGRLLTVDCRLLSSGIYFVKITTDGGSVVKKLVKN